VSTALRWLLALCLIVTFAALFAAWLAGAIPRR